MQKINLDNMQVKIDTEDEEIIKNLMGSKEILKQLVNECFELNNEEKQIAEKLKNKRKQLRCMIEEHKINKIIVNDFTVVYILSKRFDGWTDEEEMKNMIPEEHLFASMSFDKKKIEALIETEQISKNIMAFIKNKTVKSIRFTPAENIQTD